VADNTTFPDEPTMAIDPYAMCPCGSGKKLKFCCSDLVGEIEKIHRMIEGEQPRAALRHVEQTLASHPGRASLLDLKATLELSLGEIDSARETVKEFVAANRDSPTAFACEALLLAETDQPRAAVDSLQRALSLVDREMPLRVFEALGAVGGALLEAGHILGAQAHLWLHAALAPKDDTRSREVLAALNHYSGLPLLLRDQLRFRPWPAAAPWKAEAEKATRLADNGKWREAVEIIDQLGQRYGADPSLVFNRALVGGWLADDRALVAGLHAFAELDVPLDDAIEAEAIAQLLDADQKEPRLDSLIQTYAVNDLDALVPRLLSDKRLQSFQMDPELFRQRDQPRPRNTFVLLDRAMPESGAQIARDDVPRLAGVIAIYGRQTDRPERLELTIDKGPQFDATIKSLKEIAADALGDVIEEKVVGSVSPTDQALNWRWHMPPDTPPEVRRRLFDEERRAAIVDRWPQLPKPALRGKTPEQAAGDPELRIPLMSAVLILEQAGSTDRDAEAAFELRTKLGLPQSEPLDPESRPMSALPLVRIPRLKLTALSDEDLVLLYRRSILVGAHGATVRLAQEAVRRPSVADRIPPADAYQRMIAAERNPDRALELIDAARQQSKSTGESTATWDLAELELHITSGHVAEAKESLARIERDHRDDPDVAAALYQLLYETGVIPAELPEHAHAHAAPPETAGAVAEPPGGRIWTPGSDRPAGGKSALWTPS
jgi:tetratricopeptide (TPR) repeat protein